MSRLSLAGLKDAEKRISPIFIHSPQFESWSLNQTLGCSVVLKLETANPIRSFKGRGVETTLSRFCEKQKLEEVICASAGNLGQALAYCGIRRGLKPVIYAAQNANRFKIQSMEALGADVRLVDGDFDRARVEARSASSDVTSLLIEDSEEIGTCDGAGTIGLELAKYPKKIDFVNVALGGGALASGVGCAFKSLSLDTKIIGVQPHGASAMAMSWQDRKIIETKSTNTIADGVAVRKPIPSVLNDLLELIDDVVIVSENSIKTGMRLIYEHAGIIVEPSAALGIAAVIENPERFKSKIIATILCGSNVNLDSFNDWVRVS